MNEEQCPRVLLVDDEEIIAELIRYSLPEPGGMLFRHLPYPEQSLEVALEMRPTVCLVDLRMPTLDGFGVIAKIRSHVDTAKIPVILLSSEDDPETKVKAFAAGANDYLVKWPDRRELLARILYHSSAYLAHLERDEAFQSLHESRRQLLQRTEELAKSQAALLHSQKMEVIGKLTGGVAHDFNNVLQIISNNLQLLKMLDGGNEAIQKRIGAALEGVNRGAKLASHLLAFARRQSLQPVVVNVGELLQGMDDLLRRSVGSMFALEIDVAPDIWNTLADPTQLENVILNLAINARDAMEEFGTLSIRASNACPSKGESFPGATGEYVLLEVSDTGRGMESHVLERAFEPFFSTKPTGQGTGLGLSMVYGFVKQSGGYINLESEVGRGTRVEVFLPRAQGPAEKSAEAGKESVAGGRETILVVDDEPDIRETAARLLSGLGYRVRQAADAEAALRIIENDAEIDLLFTDVVMPGNLRSSELAERARALRPRLEVLFTSGYSDGELAQGGRLAPGIKLLRKPYSMDALATKIRELLKQPDEQRAPA